MSKFFPVIHCQNYEQTLRNVSIAQDSGADGVFLINHKIPHFFLSLIAERILERFKPFSIGLNYLDLDPVTALSVIRFGIKALWSDDPRLSEFAVTQDLPQIFLDYREARGDEITYYGSVAFKYQRQPQDLQGMTRLAAAYVDVVTTSGAATGSAPEFSKIIQMRQALGDKRLAIASGISAENVRDYLPYVDDYLVATSISTDFFNLNETKTKELAKIIHGY